MKFEIYKPTQGKYTRIGTVVGVMLIVVVAAVKISDLLKTSKIEFVSQPAFRYGVPALMTAVIGLVLLWIVNRAKAADFLIATEGEMKKVSWSSRREVIGSTKVVLVTTFILASVLWAMDVGLWIAFDVLGIGPGGS
ncbi:MAG: preprotein translocase subunit SecE [Planctomycetota bacterium]|jgi:preprotein translocase subunit SecE